MKVGHAVVAVLAVVVLAPGASAAPRHTIPAAKIERDLAAGRSVVEHDAWIQRDVDLIKYAGEMKGYSGKVEGLFVCNRCRFDGSISAPHVVFERGIDLSGSTIKGRVDFHGARFREPALFEGAGKAMVFGGDADFGFAAFDDLAVFSGAEFRRGAGFSSAQFRSVARFRAAAFDESGSFGSAIFGRGGLFARAIFAGPADFTGALFEGVSDFRRATFVRRGTFSEASFVGRAEFSNAAIVDGVAFDDARFASDALFLGTQFREQKPPKWPAVLFEWTTARGRIDLQESTLLGSARFNHVTAGSLSFDGMTYGSSAKINMSDVVANDVFLGLADVRRLVAPAGKQAILHTAEETAKSDGSLGLANKLHYRLQNMASRDDASLRRIADHAFYRGVAGYFVVPFRPLFWLFGIVVFAAVVRWRLKGREREPRDELIVVGKRDRDHARGWMGARRLRRAGLEFWNALEATLLRRERVASEPPPLRRVELTVYAVLLGCFLLALANTNPTLRDMVNAIV